MDRDGDPLVVFHATNADITAFEPLHFGSATRDRGGEDGAVIISEAGIWTNTRDLAAEIGTERGLPLYLSIQNPLHIRLGDLWDMAVEHGSGTALRDAIESEGYDGIAVDDDEFGGTSWVAFRPEQVKSIDIKGTWSPDDPRIKESRMPAAAPREDAGRFRRATSWVRDLPRRSKVAQNFDRKTFFSDLMTDAMGGATGAANTLALVPLRPLLSELGKKIHSARAFLHTKEEMDAVRNDWQARTDKTARQWLDLIRKGKAENATLMDLMHRATLAGIDPSKPFDTEPFDLARKRTDQYGPESGMGTWAALTFGTVAAASRQSGKTRPPKFSLKWCRSGIKPERVTDGPS